MIRGTTPIIKFVLPFPWEYVDDIWITFEQRGIEVLTKDKEDMEVEGPDNGPTVIVRLTQTDTLRFSAGQRVEIQARIRTTCGEAIASDVATEPVERILKDGVI